MFTPCARSPRRSHVKKQLTSFDAEKSKVSSVRLFAESDLPQSHIQAEPLDPERIPVFIRKLDFLTEGEQAAARLVAYGPSAIEPLRKFLLEGTPRKIFQPRLWAVAALARLKAKEVLIEYLLQEKNIADPEDRFGEEAVESAAVRSLAAWADEEVFQFLLKLSERRMLQGLIETLAVFKRPEALPYFDRALEDDFYRPAAEAAFQKMGPMSCNTLVASAVTRRPNLPMETPSSLQRRRSATRLLIKIGVNAEHWPILRKLIDESDEELVVSAAKLGIGISSKYDRKIIARRLIEVASRAPWYLQEDIHNILVTLPQEVLFP
jgi:hypothetical protein